VSSTHRYEAAQAPVELSDADALVRALIQDLRACESSHVVDVLPGCMPR
jgi:hypothetical protein